MVFMNWNNNFLLLHQILGGFKFSTPVFVSNLRKIFFDAHQCWIAISDTFEVFIAAWNSRRTVSVRYQKIIFDICTSNFLFHVVQDLLQRECISSLNSRFIRFHSFAFFYVFAKQGMFLSSLNLVRGPSGGLLSYGTKCKFVDINICSFVFNLLVGLFVCIWLLFFTFW